MKNWNDILITPTTSIMQAIKVIDAAGLRAALVIDENLTLLGMVTDGDVRRAILKNISLEEPVNKIMNCKPTVASVKETSDQILAKLQSLQIYHIPIIDEQRRLVGFETLNRLLSVSHKENPVIVMAGGMGKRLHPLTVDYPKPMVKVGDKPVLEILLENFIKRGFKNFYFAVNYKAEMIKNYFAQGDKWGVSINYIEETKRLGTAGALSLITNIPREAFFVINADVITNIDYQCLLEYHLENKVDATMCIRKHEQIVPFGVVQRDEQTHYLLNIVEKPTRQFFVNAGIYILEPAILKMLTPNTYCDMPDLLTLCIKHNYRVATFPIREYWLDIGRHEDLEKAHKDYDEVFEC